MNSFLASVSQRVKPHHIVVAVVVWNVYALFFAGTTTTTTTTTLGTAQQQQHHSRSRAPHQQQQQQQHSGDIYDWLSHGSSQQQPQHTETRTRSSGGEQQQYQSPQQQQLLAQQQVEMLSLKSSVESINQKLDQILPVHEGVNSVVRQLDRLETTISLQSQLGAGAGAGAGAVVEQGVQEKQTLFLPIGPQDFERFNNLYQSMKKFFDFSEVAEFLVVTPQRDSDVVKRLLEVTKEHSHIIRVLEDHELVPDLKTLPTTNWMTQQVLKIGAADQVNTRFYLVLDSDLILFKPTRFSDLIRQGRAVTNVYDSMTACTREEWWRSASKVLDMPLITPTFFGVTPAFIATDLMLAMRKRIQDVHDATWSVFLLKHVFTYSFTEYTMYAVFAYNSGQFGRYHLPVVNGLYNHDKSVWFEAQFKALDLAFLVKNGAFIPGHFVVMQSNTGIEAAAVKEKMGDLFV